MERHPSKTNFVLQNIFIVPPLLLQLKSQDHLDFDEVEHIPGLDLVVWIPEWLCNCKLKSAIVFAFAVLVKVYVGLLLGVEVYSVFFVIDSELRIQVNQRISDF